MITKANGERIARSIYQTIVDVYDGDDIIDLDRYDIDQWCIEVETGIGFMTEAGALSANDLLDLAYFIADGDTFILTDMLENGGIHRYLGGYLFAKHHDIWKKAPAHDFDFNPVMSDGNPYRVVNTLGGILGYFHDLADAEEFARRENKRYAHDPMNDDVRAYVVEVEN